MIALKDYQSRVLDSLRDFFRIAAREQSPELAFREITSRAYGIATPYISEIERQRPLGSLFGFL